MPRALLACAADRVTGRLRNRGPRPHPGSTPTRSEREPGRSIPGRRGAQTRFGGFAFRADDEADLLRLADKTGSAPVRLPESIGGQAVRLV